MDGVLHVLSLLCGLALFLYGMEVMSDALKRSAGNQLKSILGRMTSNPVSGFILGLVVTAVVQSSSATTVMVVGFVNSGTMSLRQSVGVIMGSNLGAALTAWIVSLSGIDAGEGASAILTFLKPSTWIPILAMIGIFMNLFSKRGRKKDIGAIFLGFTVLMVGMENMSNSVAFLRDSESFRSMFTMFSNPLLGLLVGLVVTAIIQSSGASVGILQSLTTTGAITYGAAIPIIVGQNIGTCVTALISSMGAGKNGKRAALIHLYFNIIGAVVVLGGYSILDLVFDFSFADSTIDMWGVAAVHTIFKIISIAIIAPFSRQLERLAVISVREGGEKNAVSLLDERLLVTPSVAADRAEEVTVMMAEMACESFKQSVRLLEHYDDTVAQSIRESESQVDVFEDALGTYLVNLASHEMLEADSRKITKLLHIIGDFERISDHAVNMVESAEEIKDKKISFSGDARNEIRVLSDAISDILDLTFRSFKDNDLDVAVRVEPLEQVVDHLKEQIRLHHVLRVQNSECSIEHGFVLSDVLTNFERVSDHCSNVAGCIIEISEDKALNMHQYLGNVKKNGAQFEQTYNDYRKKYALELSE